LATLPINSAGELNNVTIFRLRGDYFLHALVFVPWMIFYPAWEINQWFWLFYGVLFAACTEAVQYVLPYREYNVSDLAANVIGIFVGIVIIALYRKTKRLSDDKFVLRS
jgi:VanZ family protein